jgi:AcrR family transcriptional regulator
MRADARRNRARVLEVAAEVFATEGLSVPVHEIARRAGVGTGTVSRHFPTKESLFEAILLGRMEKLTAEATTLATAYPATAFFRFFAMIVREGATHKGLAEALAGAGYNLDAVDEESGFDVRGRLRAMLAAAQAAGTVRADVTYEDVKALLEGCMSRGNDLDALIDVICRGLQPRPSPAAPRRRQSRVEHRQGGASDTANEL